MATHLDPALVDGMAASIADLGQSFEEVCKRYALALEGVDRGALEAAVTVEAERRKRVNADRAALNSTTLARAS